MKRVKIAKYTKEKRQKARDEYNKEQSKIKYKTFENICNTINISIIGWLFQSS